MVVVVDSGGVSLRSTDDLTALSVQTRLSIRETLVVLRTAGLTRDDAERSGGEVALVVEALRHLAQSGSTRPDWIYAWTGMLEFAARMGWVVDGGDGVLAHVVAASD